MRLSVNLKSNDYWKIQLFLLALGSTFLVYVNNTLFKVILVITNVIFLIHYFRRKIRLKVYVIPIILFTFWAYLSGQWSKYKISLDTILVLIYVSVTIFFISMYLDEYKKCIFFLKCVLFSTLCIIAYLINYYGLGQVVTERINNDVMNSNRAGTFFSVSGIICIFFFFLEKKIRYIFLLGVYLIATLFSGSKTAVFTIIIGAVVMYLLRDRNYIGKRVKNIIMATGIVVLIIALMYYVPDIYNVVGRRVFGLIDIILGRASLSKGKESTSMRYQFIVFGYEMFLKKPMLGYGLDTFRYYSPWRNMYAHANLIEIMFDLGIVGVVFFYIPYIAELHMLWKGRRQIDEKWYAFGFSFLAYSLFQSFTSVYYNDLFNYLILFTILCGTECVLKNPIEPNGEVCLKHEE